MPVSPEQLHRIVQSETEHFCDVQQALEQARESDGRTFDDPRLHARMANCGIASALIQHNLREHHGIATERLFGRPPAAPYSPSGNEFGHVILRSDTTLIDPTYGQIFSFVGIHPLSPVKGFSYPRNLALTVDTTDPEASLEPLVDALTDAAQLEISPYLQSRAPLRHKGRRALQSVIYDIYNPDHYAPYELETLHPSFDRVQALIHVSDQLREQ